MSEILITGAAGFLGKHVTKLFNQYGVKYLAPSSKDLDLTRQDSVLNYFSQHCPTTILHLAAKAAGIGGNMAAPADFIQINNAMTVNLFEAVHRYDVEYFYGVGSVCAYGSECPIPFKEDDLFLERPHFSNEPYSQSKRTLLSTQQAFRKQYGLKGLHLIPINLFGTHDHFDLKTSHVIPALIRKFHEAKVNNQAYVECWGSGEVSRGFIMAEEVAQLLFKVVTEKIDYPEPINVGPSDNIKIKDLAELIKEIVGFSGEIRWNKNYPDGQRNRKLDVTRAKNILGFESKVPLRKGLEETYNWYLENLEEIK